MTPNLSNSEQAFLDLVAADLVAVARAAKHEDDNADEFALPRSVREAIAALEAHAGGGR